MNTNELITKLQELDPSGELPVVVRCDDGWHYDIWGGETGAVQEGIRDDDEEPNCVILDATQ